MIRDQRGFAAGLLFAAIGAAAVIIARHYAFGTTRHMGPGYFPTLLGGLLALTGVAAMLRALALEGTRFGTFAWRPALAATAGVLLFAALVEPHGLVAAVLALVLVGGAGTQVRPAELLAIAVTLATLAVGIFYDGLALPFSLFGQ